MYVKGNAVLSKMFTHSGLTLNEYGLFYYLKDSPQLYFMITEDHVKIAEIMGFDYNEFDAAKEYNEFFDLLTTNQFFRPSRFISDPSEGRNRMLKELAEYLHENPIHKGYTTRQIVDMYEPLAEFNFEARHKRLLEIGDKYSKIHNKFNGKIILDLTPGYDKRDLQAGIEYFNHEYFATPLDRLEFLYAHTEQEIVNEYLKITNHENNKNP